MSLVLLLTFRLDGERYGIDAAHVTRVLPMLRLKKLPQAPPYVAGLGNIHGQSIPVIDLCMLAIGRPCKDAMSTRIIQVDIERNGTRADIGLLAEAVSEVVRVDTEAFHPTGVQVRETPYLGRVLTVGDGLLQQVEVEHLLSAEVLDMLLADAGAGSAAANDGPAAGA